MTLARFPSPLIDKKKLANRGHYRTTCPSGLITLIAAGTGSAGHLFVFRNTSSSVKVYVTRARFWWQTITGFTAAQEVGLELFKVTGYTVAHTGGTAVTPAKRMTSFATASAAAARIATTAELTAGTHTFASQPLMRRGASELADGAAVVKQSFVLDWQPRDDHPEVLGASEGLVLRSSILMGAAGTARLFAELDHFER